MCVWVDGVLVEYKVCRKIPHSATGVLSMFTSSEVGLTTPVLDTMQYPITVYTTLVCSVANIVQWLMSFYYPTSYRNQVVL